MKKQKIPVKIVQAQDMYGNKKIAVMLDVSYYLETKKFSQEKINTFKKLYLETVSKARKLFYGDENIAKKYQNVPSTVYWKLGELLRKFNEKIENEFIITNYTQALHRDFGLSKDYVYDLLVISKLFTKNEIIDSVPFSYYRALMRKSNELKKQNLLQKEKLRLNKIGRTNKLPGRENYKKELIMIIKSKKFL